MRDFIKVCFILPFIFLATSSFSQKELIIKFTPDNFPGDVRWQLETQDLRTIIAEGNLKDDNGCLPNDECEVYRAMVEDRCYSLVVYDTDSDGSGAFEVFFDDKLVVTGEDFEDRTYHNFNCSIGEVSDSAVVLKLPTPPGRKIYAPDWKEYWLQFTPEIDGYYRINTCDNALTGQGWANTTLWFYDNNDRFLQTEGAEGALGHNEDSHECSPSSGFDYLPMDAGTTYFIRVKPVEDWFNSNDSISVKVQKRPVKSGCNDPLACNYDPFAQILIPGSCLYEGECSPDLSLDEDYLRESIEVDTVFNIDNCFIEEGCLRGPGAREVIRFSTKIDNIGDADYVVGIPQNDTILFSQENCHGHYHHQGYAEYLIYKGEGQPEPVGFKSGFCVLDLDCTDAGGTLPKYLCNFMGITEGCSDIYEAYLDCQWIDITDIPDGQYTIVIRVNHFQLPDARSMQEKTYDNNSGQACVTIDRSSGILVVTVDEECPEYVDCLGIAGGDAEFDCNGDCGGTAHYGDFDESGKLEQTDLDIYMEMLESKIPLAGPCHDINDDGKLSIYDAALVYECLVEQVEQEGNPFHDHCSFPAGIDLTDQMALVRVKEFNTWDKYVDLELWVNEKDISAFQINTSGIEINKVERMYDAEPDVMTFNDETVFALHTADPYPRNTGYMPFIRISYETVTLDSLCITYDSEFVNKDFNRVTLAIENQCSDLSATDDLFEQAAFTLVPNPATDKVSVFAEGNYVETCQVLDIDGKVLMTKKIQSDSGFDLDIQPLGEGLYIMQLSFKEGTIATKRFMKSN